MPKQQALRVVAGSPPRASNQVHAMQAQTRHSFAPGRGYFEHDQPPVIHGGPPPAPVCDPPVGTPDRSRHVLTFGDKRLVFTWIATERAWARAGGLRMAFTAEYLAREGWRYAEPARG